MLTILTVMTHLDLGHENSQDQNLCILKANTKIVQRYTFEFSKKGFLKKHYDNNLEMFSKNEER